MRIGRISAVVALTVSAILTLGACGTSTPVAGSSTAVTTSAQQADVAEFATVRVSGGTGSVAPPYNHRWTVELEKTTGKITFTAPGADKPWQAEFTVTDVQRNALGEAVLAVEQSDSRRDPPPGSSVTSFLATGVDGAEHKGTVVTDLGLESAAKTLVPQQIWNKLEGQYQAWAAGYVRPSK